MNATASQSKSPTVEPVCVIPLTKGYVAIVDAADAEWLTQWRWHAVTARCGKVYAKRTIYGREKSRDVLMHREILGLQGSLKVDHRDGDGLNNRRSNLRSATHQQNLCNRKSTSSRSGYMGVYPHKRRWIAKICVRGAQIHLGLFETVEDAALARDAAALKYHGEFAFLNFREPEPPRDETVVHLANRRPRNAERDATILQLRSSGLRKSEIARRLALTLNTVIGVCDRADGGPERRGETGRRR